MIVSEVAKRYAKALYQVAKQGDASARLVEELKVVESAIFSSAELSDYFTNPMITPDQKVAVLNKALQDKKISSEITNLLVLLAEKSRLSKLPEIVAAYGELLDLEAGLTRGVVKSAKPLSSEAKAELEKKISSVLNKKIMLKYVEEPTLLGGVVAHVGGWTFDDSIETHLKKLNEELNRRAN